MTTRPVLDTDIGTDADDALAPAFALRHPEIDLAAVTTVADDTRRRARIEAVLLRLAGRDDVEVAPGGGWTDPPRRTHVLARSAEGPARQRRPRRSRKQAPGATSTPVPIGPGFQSRSLVLPVSGARAGGSSLRIGWQVLSPVWASRVRPCPVFPRPMRASEGRTRRSPRLPTDAPRLIHVSRRRTAAIAIRVLVAAGLWGGITMLGPPATAHHSVAFIDCEEPVPTSTPDPTASPSTPEPTPTTTPQPMACTPEEESVLQETLTLAFEVTADTLRPIAQVEVYITSEDSAVPSAKDGQPIRTYSFTEDDAVENRAFAVQWDTRALTPHNGSYAVRVTARTHRHASDGGQVATAERQHLRVDNPPATPGPPQVTDFSAEAVVLEWEPGREPDLASYTLYRAAISPEHADSPEVPESLFKPFRTTTNTIAIDKPARGRYRYAVSTVRRSIVTPEVGISSPLSPPSPLVAVGSGDDEQQPQAEPPADPALLPPALRAAPRDDGSYFPYLPYDQPGREPGVPVDGPQEPGGRRQRLTQLATGMFLVSAGLAAFRMPF